MTKKAVWHTIVQVVCAAVVFLLIAAFSHELMNALGELLGPPKEGDTYDLFMTRGTSIGRRAFRVLLLVWFGLIIYTFFRIALSHDRFSKRASVGEPNGLFNRIKRVGSMRSFWFELAVVLLLTLVLPSGFLHAKRLFPFATFPVVAVSFFFAHVGASGQAVDIPWGRNIRMSGIANEILRVVAHLLVILFGFPLVLFVYSNFLTHRNSTIVVVSLMVFGPFLFAYFRAVQKRRKLLKRLGKICEEKEYSYSFEKAYRSILLPSREPEIRIQTGQGTFACVLLHSFSKKTPLYLSRLMEEEGLLIGRGTLTYRTAALRPSFEPGDKKVLVLVPVPLNIFRRGEDDGWHPLYAADRVGDYTVYSLSSFLNALDLDALDAARKTREW